MDRPSSNPGQTVTQIIYPELSYAVQGALYSVYNELRHFELSEAGWEQALLIALAEQSLAAEQQKEYALHYKGYRIGRFFVDVLVEDKLLLELKVKEAFQPIDQAQVITYLKVSGLQLGILVNFGGDNLEFQRIPNFIDKRYGKHPQESASQPEAHWLYSELTGMLRAAFYEVYNQLGPGFMHMHYRRAMQIELRLRGIPYEIKKEVAICFHGHPIERRETRLLLVDDKVLVAPMAVGQITASLQGRFRQYLRFLGLKLGLLANFCGTSLEIQTVRL